MSKERKRSARGQCHCKKYIMQPDCRRLGGISSVVSSFLLLRSIAWNITSTTNTSIIAKSLCATHVLNSMFAFNTHISYSVSSLIRFNRWDTFTVHKLFVCTPQSTACNKKPFMQITILWFVKSSGLTGPTQLTLFSFSPVASAARLSPQQKLSNFVSPIL